MLSTSSGRGNAGAIITAGAVAIDQATKVAASVSAAGHTSGTVIPVRSLTTSAASTRGHAVGRVDQFATAKSSCGWRLDDRCWR